MEPVLYSDCGAVCPVSLRIIPENIKKMKNMINECLYPGAGWVRFKSYGLGEPVRSPLSALATGYSKK